MDHAGGCLFFTGLCFSGAWQYLLFVKIMPRLCTSQCNMTCVPVTNLWLHVFRRIKKYHRLVPYYYSYCLYIAPLRVHAYSVMLVRPAYIRGQLCVIFASCLRHPFEGIESAVRLTVIVYRELLATCFRSLHSSHPRVVGGKAFIEKPLREKLTDRKGLRDVLIQNFIENGRGDLRLSHPQ